MYPVGAFAVVLPDELVVLAVGANPLEPLAAFLHIAVDTEVCGLASHVLRVAHTTDCIIQGEASESAAYLDGLLHRVPEWLQYMMHQRTEIDDVRLTWVVADAQFLRRLAGAEFFEREVFADLNRHCMRRFRFSVPR